MLPQGAPVKWRQETAQPYLESHFAMFPLLQVSYLLGAVRSTSKTFHLFQVAQLGAWEQRRGERLVVHESNVIHEDAWIEEPLQKDM